MDETTLSGGAFLLANSIVFGKGKGFKFSIDVDYLTGAFTKEDSPSGEVDIDDDNGINKFSLGAGIRYNF